MGLDYAFRPEGLRPRGLPALPWVSAFPELNFRAYVTRDRTPGVFFFSLHFSLHAARTAVMGARAAFHLPYFLAVMRKHVGRARTGSSLARGGLDSYGVRHPS